VISQIDERVMIGGQYKKSKMPLYDRLNQVRKFNALGFLRFDF